MWELEPHTKVKHEILRRYLAAWMPIVTQHARKRAYYFDAFAGPGRYTKGEPGSPLIAIDTALDHRPFKRPVHMTFIDEDPSYVAALEQALEGYRDRIAAASNVELHRKVLCGTCEDELTRIVDSIEANQGSEIPPCLFFLDQYGYSAAPMSLIKRLLAHPRWETFGLIEWNRLNQTMTDQMKWPAFDRAFGDDRWKQALDLQGGEREQFLVSTYRAALQEAGADFTWHFAMRNQQNQLIYWLFFASKGIKGLEQMKKAMKSADPSGGDFRFSAFSDAGGDQGPLFEYGDEQLAEESMKTFRGQQVNLDTVYRYVLTSTPATAYATALGQLERQNRIVVPNAPRGRRKGSFEKYRKEGTPLLVRFARL